MKITYKRVALGLLITAGTIGTLLSQNPGVKRTVVEKADTSAAGREANIAAVEIQPGASVGRHTHPGEEISYIFEGEAEILVEGQPPRRVKAGEGFIIPNGVKHDARNVGTGVLKLSAVYLIEKGKPLATPAP